MITQQMRTDMNNSLRFANLRSVSTQHLERYFTPDVGEYYIPAPNAEVLVFIYPAAVGTAERRANGRFRWTASWTILMGVISGDRTSSEVGLDLIELAEAVKEDWDETAAARRLRYETQAWTAAYDAVNPARPPEWRWVEVTLTLGYNTQ